MVYRPHTKNGRHLKSICHYITIKKIRETPRNPQNPRSIISLQIDEQPSIHQS